MRRRRGRSRPTNFSEQELMEKISEIMIEFLNIVCSTKETVDISYEEVSKKF